MAEAILVPQVGQDLTEATIVELLVKVGDSVKKGDLVAVVESEKANFEVEAFAEGVVIDLPYKEGDIATVLEPLMHVGAVGEKIEASPQRDTGGGETAASSTQAPPVPDVGAEVTSPAPVVSTPSVTLELPAGGIRRASPVARRMAREHGLDLAQMAGTGPKGAVVLKDVTRALDQAGPQAGIVPAGTPLQIRTFQDGPGAPIVFLHGFGADLSSWRPMVGQLGGGLPMKALDLPGHGASIGHAAADFASVVDAVGQSLRSLDGGMHLVGHSLGAAVATALTERGDLDIRSLTLISPAGLGASIDGDFVDGFLAARTEAALTTWMRRLVHDPADLAPVLVRATLAARDDLALVEAQGRVARGVFEGGTQVFSIAEALRRYEGPCTVIAGRQDGIVRFRELEAQVPAHVAFHRLDRTGHLPQVEAADLVRKLIVRTIRAAG